MKSLDCGVLPVGEQEKLEGIITDRDIVLSAVAEGKDVTQERVKDHMTSEVFCCDEENTLEDAAKHMHDHQVNRLIINDKDGKMSGILSFGRILREDDSSEEVARVAECAIGGRKAA